MVANNIHDELSDFSQANPMPIIGLDYTGKIFYLNLSARTHFPSIVNSSSDHPILKGLREKFINFDPQDKKLVVFSQDVFFNDCIYEQEAFSIPEKRTIFIYMIDITERVKAEEEIKKINIELEKRVKLRTDELLRAKNLAEQLAIEAKEASKAKSEFLAVMSHEIRTPLNGVIGMTSLLLESNLTPQQRNDVETIKLSGEVLLSVINDVLDFSKIESGRLIVEDSPFGVRELIHDVIEIFSVQIHKKNIDFSAFVEPDVPNKVIGDGARIRQVLVNFLSNAVKFTHKGSIKMHCSLAKPIKDKIAAVKFEVSDTGIGISEENLEKLFKPFTQADASTSRKYGGSGLGLAISKRLIEIMGGHIHADSVVDEGSKFSFVLPLKLE